MYVSGGVFGGVFLQSYESIVGLARYSSGRRRDKSAECCTLIYLITFHLNGLLEFGFVCPKTRCDALIGISTDAPFFVQV